jgi:hypothetical protein
MSGPRLSDLELARRASPGVPDAKLVTELAQRTLDELAMDPPINHEIVASLRDVIRIEQTVIPWAGCLVHHADGLVIKLRVTDSRGRQRFTAFHEIKHTFLPGFTFVTQYRCDPATPLDASRVRDRDLEALCDIGAVELLLPRMAFADDLAGNAPTLDLVEHLAARYDASLEATARRVVALRADPTMLIALEPARKPSAPHAEPRLRVQWVHASGAWPYVPQHKSVPSDSVLARPLSGEPVDETGHIRGLTTAPIRDVRISAGLYPYADDRGEQHMRVLALITPIQARRTRVA